MGLLEGFFWGVAGGMGAELLGLFRLRRINTEEFPRWLETRFYWYVTTGMIVFGGLLVVAYLRSNTPLSPLVAINIGATAPLLLSTFADQGPHIEPGTIDQENTAAAIGS